MKHKVKIYVFFILIVFLYLLLRIHFSFLGGDEPAYALNAKMILKGKMPVIDFWSQNMDFYHFFFAGWMKIFGEDIVAIRMLTVILVILTNILLIILLDRIGARIFGVLAGLVLLNFNCLFNSLTLQAEHYSTAVTFFFYSYFILVYYYIKEKNGNRKQIWSYFLSGLFLAFAYNSRINLLVFFPVFLFFIYYTNLEKKKQVLKSISAFIIGGFIGSSIAIYQLLKVGLNEFIYMKVLWRQQLPYYIAKKFTDKYFYSHLKQLFFSNWQNLILWSLNLILLIIVFKFIKDKNIRKLSIIAVFNFFIVVLGLSVYFQSGHFQIVYFGQFIPYLVMNIMILLQYKKHLWNTVNIPKAIKTITTSMVIIIFLSYSALHIPDLLLFGNARYRAGLDYKNIQSVKELGKYLKKKIGINNLILDPYGAVSFYSDNFNHIGMISGNCIAYSLSDESDFFDKDFLGKNKMITREEINYLIENKLFKAIVVSPYMHDIDIKKTQEYYKKELESYNYKIYFP